MALDDYQRKRDFNNSPEPMGRAAMGLRGSELLFVVQKHNARNLHYDLRLEHAGVLKSWAVPRGPSLDPRVRRLAVEVEDHPLEYANFEGVIPPGHYGAGEVLVWDMGTWQPHGNVSEMLQSGKLEFRLRGHRLRGDWRLIRTRMKGKQHQWLLSKQEDDEARSDFEIVERYVDSIFNERAFITSDPLPEFIPPKLPTLTTDPPRGDDWVHELKLDGYRMQAQWRAAGFRLLTRSGLDWTSRYADIANELSQLELQGTIIDGELTALDGEGKSTFDLLQQTSRHTGIALAFFAFDLLYLRDVDQRDQSLLDRKAALKTLLQTVKPSTSSPRLQYLDHIESDATALMAQCRSLGLEGIVSKRTDRTYSSGRAADWLKTKFRYRDSFIVVGYETSGKPAMLSSLLLAYFDESNDLHFAGRVGTGWNEGLATKLLKRLAELSTDDSPLLRRSPTAKLAAKSERGGKVKLLWVQPVVVADVEFASWTKSRRLRHASFVGINEEAAPQDVTARQLFAERAPSQGAVARPTKPNTSPSIAATSALPGLSHSDRVLYPREQLTKRDVAIYLYQVNQWLLPHLAYRPVSLLRCTDGIHGKSYFQRHPGTGFPPQFSTLGVAGEGKPLMSIDNVEALLATAQINAIELHPWGCHGDDLERPDRMTVDLDPDETVAWNVVVEAAFLVRAELEQRGLKSFVKTTGGKGLHVVVPLSLGEKWDDVFRFSKSFATDLAQTYKSLFVATMTKARRRNRIFVDYHRNRRGSTAIAAYSLRARPGATVSTPITWEELPSIHPAHFTLRTVPGRLARIDNDPWSEIGLVEQGILVSSRRVSASHQTPN